MDDSRNNYLSNYFMIGDRGMYIDTRLSMDAIPQCFETMVFRATRINDDHFDIDFDECYDVMRYDIWKDAEKGHKALYDKWKKIVKNMPHGDLAYYKKEDKNDSGRICG